MSRPEMSTDLCLSPQLRMKKPTEHKPSTIHRAPKIKGPKNEPKEIKAANIYRTLQYNKERETRKNGTSNSQQINVSVI